MSQKRSLVPASKSCRERSSTRSAAAGGSISAPQTLHRKPKEAKSSDRRTVEPFCTSSKQESVERLQQEIHLSGTNEEPQHPFEQSRNLCSIARVSLNI